MARDGRFDNALREAFMAGAGATISGGLTESERATFEEDFQRWRSQHFGIEGE